MSLGADMPRMRVQTIRIVVLMVSITREAIAHGQLTVPRPRLDTNGNSESHLQEEPVFTLDGPRAQYSATSMRCHDFGPSSEKTTITAGANLALTWTMSVPHPGDCYVYVSYDGANPVNFFKIAQFLGCGVADGLDPPRTVTETILIPAELPPCEHCVLRWEWTSHQRLVNIEFHAQCVDVEVVSTAGLTKPDPITAIAGIEHLLAAPSRYRQAHNNPPLEDMLVCPKVATFTSCTAGSLGCIGTTTIVRELTVANGTIGTATGTGPRAPAAPDYGALAAAAHAHGTNVWKCLCYVLTAMSLS
jgi:hypothetical protein